MIAQKSKSKVRTKGKVAYWIKRGWGGSQYSRPSRMREEARIQEEVQNRLRYLSNHVGGVRYNNSRTYVDKDYVTDLLDDATDFSWASAKANHAVLFVEWSKGRLRVG